MSKKISIEIRVGHLDNCVNKTRICKSCWDRLYADWTAADAWIPIMSQSGTKVIGKVKAQSYVYYDEPVMTFTGELFSDGECDFSDKTLSQMSINFAIEEGSIRKVQSFFDLIPHTTIVNLSVKHLVLVPKADSLYNVTIKAIGEPVYQSPFNCAHCTEVFEPFEHIIRYRGKLLHEACFLSVATEILQAEELHLDSNGNISEEVDDDFIDPVTSIFDLD